MLFVSEKKDGKFGVFDTDDGVVEYYTGEELWRILNENKGLHIYGTSPYNHDACCSVLVRGVPFSVSTLVSLIRDSRRPHNRWSVAPIGDYLAMVRPGSSFVLHVRTTDYSADYLFRKLDVDVWEVDGEKMTSELAKRFLDANCCGVYRISRVKGNNDMV